MYQHWADKERDNSSKHSEDVIKMLEMFSEKKNSSSKKNLIVLSKVLSRPSLKYPPF